MEIGIFALSLIANKSRHAMRTHKKGNNMLFVEWAKRSVTHAEACIAPDAHSFRHVFSPLESKLGD